MGPDLGMVGLIRWVTVMFPSISEYTSILTPIIVVGFSILNMFSNILPEPGYKFPIPELDDLEVELRPTGRIIYVITRFSRTLTMRANIVVASKPYAWFYKSTKMVSKIAARLKGGSQAGPLKEITKPSPFKVTIRGTKPDEKKND